jgi:hypothetical protein
LVGHECANSERRGDERVVGIDNFSRVLAAPVETAGHRYILLVGGSLQDRRDEVLQLAATLAISGLALLLLAGLALVLAIESSGNLCVLRTAPATLLAVNLVLGLVLLFWYVRE